MQILHINETSNIINEQFENGGKIHLLSAATKKNTLEKYTVVPIVEHYFREKEVDAFNLQVKTHFKNQTLILNYS